MTKCYVMSGGAKHVLPQDGVTVVEFTEDQVRAANVLHAMPEDDRNALFAHAAAHPAAPKAKRGRKAKSAAQTPSAPTGKKRGRKSNAERAAAAAAGTAPVVTAETKPEEVKSEAA